MNVVGIAGRVSHSSLRSPPLTNRHVSYSTRPAESRVANPEPEDEIEAPRARNPGPVRSDPIPRP
jgi:hypothetical protein